MMQAVSCSGLTVYFDRNSGIRSSGTTVHFRKNKQYAKTEFTDDLQKAFGINTSMQIVTIEKMRNICHQTKE